MEYIYDIDGSSRVTHDGYLNRLRAAGVKIPDREITAKPGDRWAYLEGGSPVERACLNLLSSIGSLLNAGLDEGQVERVLGLALKEAVSDEKWRNAGFGMRLRASSPSADVS